MDLAGSDRGQALKGLRMVVFRPKGRTWGFLRETDHSIGFLANSDPGRGPGGFDDFEYSTKCILI